MATVTYKKGKLYDLPLTNLKADPNHESVRSEELGVKS